MGSCLDRPDARHWDGSSSISFQMSWNMVRVSSCCLKDFFFLKKKKKSNTYPINQVHIQPWHRVNPLVEYIIIKSRTWYVHIWPLGLFRRHHSPTNSQCFKIHNPRKSEDNLLQVTKYRIRLDAYRTPRSESLNPHNSRIKSSPIPRQIKSLRLHQQTWSQRHSAMKRTEARHTVDVPVIMAQSRDFVKLSMDFKQGRARCNAFQLRFEATWAAAGSRATKRPVDQEIELVGVLL